MERDMDLTFWNKLLKLEVGDVQDDEVAIKNPNLWIRKSRPTNSNGEVWYFFMTKEPIAIYNTVTERWVKEPTLNAESN